MKSPKNEHEDEIFWTFLIHLRQVCLHQLYIHEHTWPRPLLLPEHPPLTVKLKTD